MSCLCFQSSHDLHQLKKSIAPPPGKYNIASALLFHVIQYNSDCFCRASFPLQGAGAFYCRFFGKAPEVCHCRSPPPLGSPVDKPVNRNGGT